MLVCVSRFYLLSPVILTKQLYTPYTPPRELKSCTARPRLGLTISFASLTTSLTTSAIYINKRESALVSHNFTILPPSILPSTKCARKSGAKRPEFVV